MKKGQFSNEVEIRRGIAWKKIPKKIFLKKMYGSNWKKSPD